MIRFLIVTHRWLGLAFCLLFAMWFATGIVMHFVPYPALSEAERIAGLAAIDPGGVRHGAAEAARASGFPRPTRVRLFQRSDGPVYLISDEARIRALRADDLSDAAVRSEQLALNIAVDHARRRRLNADLAGVAELAFHDQWTVPNALDAHRPLYRIGLNDASGTELYVSTTTGEVVRDTTRRERRWNYVGSVSHWIYPTLLRKNWAAWDAVVWWLSLGALVVTIIGVVLGPLRLKFAAARLRSPYRGWHGLHHWSGLICGTFVLTYIFSGWLSMDHGRLFSLAGATESDLQHVLGLPDWSTALTDVPGISAARSLEIEWFAFGHHTYRRERGGLAAQELFAAGRAVAGESGPAFLAPDDVAAAGKRLDPICRTVRSVDDGDDYAIAASMPNAPVYRLVCGDVWFHIDAASGAILEKLDPSRRRYRWLYGALHKLDFPSLSLRPQLRTISTTLLCGFGFLFSATGVVIAWRRLVTPAYRRRRDESAAS